MLGSKETKCEKTFFFVYVSRAGAKAFSCCFFHVLFSSARLYMEKNSYANAVDIAFSYILHKFTCIISYMRSLRLPQSISSNSFAQLDKEPKNLCLLFCAVIDDSRSEASKPIARFNPMTILNDEKEREKNVQVF